MGDLDDLATQIFGHLVGRGWMAITEAAGATLGQVMQLDHLADGAALGLWG
jgi:hypothetical protein